MTLVGDSLTETKFLIASSRQAATEPVAADILGRAYADPTTGHQGGMGVPSPASSAGLLRLFAQGRETSGPRAGQRRYRSR